MRRQTSKMLVLMFTVSMLVLPFGIQPSMSNPTTITVPNDYPTVQEAINHANAGDTIFVRAGTYVEHIDIDKPIVLKGESSQNTTLKVRGSGNTGAGLHVLASDATISGFNMTNDIDSGAHVLVFIDGREGPCDNVLFTDNVVMPKTGARADALIVWLSTGTKISNNLVIGDCRSTCIDAMDSHSCVVDNNTINGGWLGIYCVNSNSMLVSNNFLTNQVSAEYSGAISLMGSSNTTVVGNTVANNEKGIYLQRETGDRIYHNNFINNSQQVQFNIYELPPVAVWDDGYPLGGNYWSDYNGTDVHSGGYQNETGSDGIGDTPYVIGSGNQDNYPLTGPYWNPADINRDLRIDVGDVYAVSRAFGSSPSDSRWNPLCDINENLIVDITDTYTVCRNYGKTYP